MPEQYEVQRLACLELRGGNEHARYSIELPGLTAWISCHPMKPAVRGGDLHYLSVCSQGFVSRIAVADVAGHGEFVAAVADRLRGVMREHSDAWDQSEVVRELNDSFLAGATSFEYATAFVLGHYSRSGEILFTNAGHLPPLWYHADERAWSFMLESTPYAKEVADLPLGMIAGTPYSQTAVQLGTGDLVVLYTDGITESTDPSGKELDRDGLLALARKMIFNSAVEAGEALLAGVQAYRGTSPASDDETLIVLQRSPSMIEEAWPR